ncbi:hypothetical protein AADZ90_021225 [Aestuariibius sp. 2305UL40-4]|uniref:hypothetical protein n=1 Tax=Aestuariibius violaceus TaxID=3234132 RepID=UPI00345E4847
MAEPNISINGTRLTEGQAMAVRVAIASYLSEMQNPDALGDDRHGRNMAAAYKDRLSEVVNLY